VPDSVKRTYRSPARAAAAAATRARLRHAAERLFTAQGYAATTMRQTAREADVGERTLYDAFSTKAVLFGHTLGVAVAGDEEPVPVVERPWVRAVLAERDPVVALGLLAANSTQLLDRAGDLIMVSLEAAGTDADMRSTADAGEQATYAVQRTIAARLHERGALREDLDAQTAADILYVLIAPHTHQLLRRHRRWSAEKYQQWIRDAMVREVLDPVKT
jgi:AcrR family transcriptional regulator